MARREDEPKEQDLGGDYLTIGAQGTPLRVEVPIMERYVREQNRDASTRTHSDPLPTEVHLMKAELQQLLGELPISVAAGQDAYVRAIHLVQSIAPYDRSVATGEYHLSMVLEGHDIGIIPPKLPIPGYEFTFKPQSIPTGEVDEDNQPIKALYNQISLRPYAWGVNLPRLGVQPLPPSQPSADRRVASVTVYTPFVAR